VNIKSTALNLGLGGTYETGNALTITTALGSDIVKKEQENLRLIYRIERCKIEDYDAYTDNQQEVPDSVWTTIIADDRDYDKVTNWDSAVANSSQVSYKSDITNRAALFSYYGYGYSNESNASRTSYDDITYDPVQNQIIGTESNGNNKMVMSYYAGGLITPGYYYRVSTRVYQIETDKAGNVRYNNVTSADTESSSQESNGTSYDDYHLCSEAVKWNSWKWTESTQPSIMKSVLVYTELNALNVTFALYDYNNTSIDGNYFIRLAKQNDQGEWEVLDSGVTCEGLAGGYTGALKMNQTYTGVRFTGLESERKYRLQFYAIMDTDFDNKVDLSSNIKTDTPMLLDAKSTTEVLDTSTYYTNLSVNKRKDMTSRLTDKMSGTGIYATYYGTATPFTNSSAVALKDSNAMVAYSSEMKTKASNYTSYAGLFSTFTVNSANPQQISVNYTGAYNTTEIAKIEYDITYSYTDDSGSTKTVYYVQNSLLPNPTDGFSFSSTKGRGTLTFNFNTQEEQSSEVSSEKASSLNFIANKGNYDIVLRFYKKVNDSYQLIYKAEDWTPTIS
jgi:hypothetical protein